MYKQRLLDFTILGLNPFVIDPLVFGVTLTEYNSISNQEALIE